MLASSASSNVVDLVLLSGSPVRPKSFRSAAKAIDVDAPSDDSRQSGDSQRGEPPSSCGSNSSLSLSEKAGSRGSNVLDGPPFEFESEFGVGHEADASLSVEESKIASAILSLQMKKDDTLNPKKRELGANTRPFPTCNAALGPSKEEAPIKKMRSTREYRESKAKKSGTRVVDPAVCDEEGNFDPMLKNMKTVFRKFVKELVPPRVHGWLCFKNRTLYGETHAEGWRDIAPKITEIIVDKEGRIPREHRFRAQDDKQKTEAAKRIKKFVDAFLEEHHPNGSYKAVKGLGISDEEASVENKIE